jgi:hypothetical protein
MIRVRVNATWVVRCRAELELKLSPLSVWGQLRDFRRYARQDLFHEDIQIDGGLPRPGARLKLLHCYGGIRVKRHGRILLWREGVGFAFSDLSHRGPRHGFPHVLSFRIEPTDGGSCLHIRATGLWTARATSRLLARVWLRWVFAHVVRSVRNELMLYQLWRKQARPSCLC